MLAEPDSQKSYANQWMSNFDVCWTIVIGFERLFGSFDKNLLRGFQTDQMTNTSGNESDRDIYYHLCHKCIRPCLRIDKSDTFSRLCSIVKDWHFRNMIPTANGPLHLQLFFPSMDMMALKTRVLWELFLLLASLVARFSDEKCWQGLSANIVIFRMIIFFKFGQG